MSDREARAVLIIGPLASGKTALAIELGEILGSRGLPNAVIDLDWLGWATALEPGRTIDDLIASNLEAVLQNFLAAGVRHLVLARAIESRAQIHSIRGALPGAEVQVVSLDVSSETAAARLRRRDTGSELAHNLEESGRFSAVASDVEADHCIGNEEREIREVAEELVELLGWL